MTTQAPQIAPAVPGQIEMTARRLSVVTVRGVNYEFSITGSISDKRCDELVKNHIELLLAASKRDSFDTIKSVIKKNDLATTNNGASPFILESSEVTYLSKKGKVKKEDAVKSYINPISNNPQTVSPETVTKVNKFWNATQQSLVDLTSGAPDPVQSAPLSPASQNTALQTPANPATSNPPIVESPRNIITTYKNRAKKMGNPPNTSEQSQVQYALASQLYEAKYPNNAGRSDEKIREKQGLLIGNYKIHIEKNFDLYCQTGNFSEILKDIRANLKKNPVLIKEIFNSVKSAFLSPLKISEDQFEELLNASNFDTFITTMSLDKENIYKGMMKIYTSCVEKGLPISEKLFLNSFISTQQIQGFLLNVFVISPDGAERAYKWINDSNPITDDKRCLFLYVDEQGRYQSIPRSRSASHVTETLTNAPIADDGNKNRDTSIELGLLIDLYDCYERTPVKNYILGRFATDYPQAFERLKHFIWLNDCKKWDDNPNHTGNRPGSNNDLAYGDRTLRAMNADDLEALLTSNRAKILAVGRNKGTVI